MALTESTMLALGTTVPDFALPDTVTRRSISVNSFEGKKALLVMFICNHCPFVKHVSEELTRLGSDYAEQSVGIVAINSNDVDTHPDDAPDKMKHLAETLGWNFPYCYDNTQQAARAYNAACTPDFFVFGIERTLAYRGQLDDSRPENNRPVTGRDLRAALDAVLAGEPVNDDQRPSIGCNIKWKPGNEPK